MGGNRIFAVYGALGGSLTLRNLNIGGGRAVAPSGVGAAYGGAIYAQGPLTLDHVTLVGNHAGGGTERDCGYPIEFCDAVGIGTWAGRPGAGGAVYATGSLTVRSSVFESNTATGGSGDDGGAALGGAIGLGDTATATISDSIFVSNVARGGSGRGGHQRDRRRATDATAGTEPASGATSRPTPSGRFPRRSRAGKPCSTS